MRNLIQDFWTYEYKDRRYYGVIEVAGGDLTYRRTERKFETRIEKALKYLEGKEMLSHMSLQAYNQYLNKDGRERREEQEEAFYPFFMEFEPNVKPGYPGFWPEYQNAIQEANQTVSYMIYELGVDPEDLLICITNSRSVYLFVNPVTYKLRPSNKLHEIYKNMFEEMDEVLNFQYVDTKMFRFNGLIKTPGAYYAGGFVVPVSVDELKQLAADPIGMKLQLTREQRSIDREVPGKYAGGLDALYINALETVDEASAARAKKAAIRVKTPQNVTYLSSGIACIEHLERSVVAPGQRNYALVSLAIGYKNAGYSEAQATDLVQDAAARWNHDEDERMVASKVRVVYRRDYNFSCEYIKEHVDLCGSCDRCKLNKKSKNAPSTKFWVGRDVIDQLKANKASLRHYKAYLVMSRKNLIGEYFNPEEMKLDPRVIRELVNMTGGERTVQNGLVKVVINHGHKKYLIPNEFVDQEEYLALGERLKPFLILYTHFIYKATNKYGMMRVKPETIAAALGYKSMSSVYKMLQDLMNLGMAVFKNGYLFSLYFSSYKVVSMDEYKSLKTKKTSNISQEFEAENNRKTGTYDHGETREFIKLSRGSP